MLHLPHASMGFPYRIASTESMTNRLLSALLAALAGLLLSHPAMAQPQFEEMKAAMDSNSLPLVNLTVNIKQVNTSTFVDGQIEIADYARRTDPNFVSTQFRCQLRYRGGSSTGKNKKNFAVKLVDEAGDKLNASLFGIRPENSWILDAMAIDRLRMRNRICFDIWNEISRTPYPTDYDGRNGTEGLFVEVFLNGTYHGLYCLTDKVDRKLLGLKKVKVDEAGTVTHRGLLYKGISWDSGYDLLSYKSGVSTSSTTWNAWELQYPEDYPSAQAWQPLKNLIKFCSSNTTDPVFVHTYTEYFYPENLVDYFVFTMAFNVGDNAWKNTFFSTTDITQGHRYLITPWDMDMSLGGVWNGSYAPDLVDLDKYNDRAPYNRLYVKSFDYFRRNVNARWAELAATSLSVEHVNELIDTYASQFINSGAWEREYKKWTKDPVDLREDLTAEADYVKDWYEKNYKFLVRKWGRPTGITLTQEETPAPEGIFTIDGRQLGVRSVKQLPPGLYIVNGRKMMVR